MPLNNPITSALLADPEIFQQNRLPFHAHFADLCRTSQEPVYLTRNGEGDLVVMDMETFSRREKMLDLREQLLSVEEDRMAGNKGYTIDELDKYLDDIISGV